MGSESKSDSKTTTQVLTPEQQALVGMALPEYQKFNSSNPTLPGSAGVAGFDPLQTEGQNKVLGSVGQAQNTVDSASGANQWLTSGAALDPNTNPALHGAIDAAVRPIYDNLNLNTLPQISAGASTGSGGISANLGGSRQGIAEGLASRGASIAAGDAASKVASAGYGQGLDALLKSVGMAPQTAASSTIPGGITSTVGDVRQQQAQQKLTADAQAKQFADFLPYLKAQFLTQGAQGLPGGSTVSTGTSNTDANPVSQVIGGASAAGGLAGGLAKLAPFLLA